MRRRLHRLNVENDFDGKMSMIAALSNHDEAMGATLNERAYQRIREMLMSGRFEPGQKMTIRGLASLLGISPTPVREAVRRLAAEGAIEMAPNRWMKVPLLTAADLRELRDIRVMLEGLATERAVMQVSDESIAEIKGCDRAIVALRGTGDVKAMTTAIHRFHFTIYRAAHMPALLRIVESLWLRTGPHVNLLFPGYTSTERGQLRTMEADIGNAVDYLIVRAETQAAAQ